MAGDGNGNENVKKCDRLNRQNNNFARVETPISTFRCRHCTKTTWNTLRLGVKKARRNILSLSELGCGNPDKVSETEYSQWREFTHSTGDVAAAMTVLGSLGPHCVAPCKGILGSFSIDDGNGSENVSFKMNSRFFNLCRVLFQQFAENGKCRPTSSPGLFPQKMTIFWGKSPGDEVEV